MSTNAILLSNLAQKEVIEIFELDLLHFSVAITVFFCGFSLLSSRLFVNETSTIDALIIIVLVL